MSRKWSSIRDVSRILIVIVAIVLTACSKKDGEASAKEQLDATTKSSPKSELVDVWLEDEHSRKRIHFRLPRGYLSQWRDVLGRKNPNNSGGEQVQMIIETGLPELQPRAATFWVAEETKKIGAERANEKSRNGLLIELNGAIPIAAYEARVRAQLLSTYHRDASLDVAGLDGYSGNTCKEVAHGDGRTIQCAATNQDEIYFPQRKGESGGSRLIFMRCTRPSENVGGGCTAYELYRYRDMEFIFRRSELNRWREFEKASHDLLDRFLVSDE